MARTRCFTARVDGKEMLGELNDCSSTARLNFNNNILPAVDLLAVNLRQSGAWAAHSMEWRGSHLPSSPGPGVEL